MRQMAAAMALGAQGVWYGSVWLTTEEAEAISCKEKMLQNILRQYDPDKERVNLHDNSNLHGLMNGETKLHATGMPTTSTD